MSISSAEWLSSCPQEIKITGLLLPGTHDTMTAPCPQRYYHTQTLTLEEQLETGVRFLDIRLRREMVAAHREWISTISANDIANFTGNAINMEAKAAGPQVVTTSRNWRLADNHGKVYDAADGDWLSVHDDIFVEDNWAYVAPGTEVLKG